MQVSIDGRARQGVIFLRKVQEAFARGDHHDLVATQAAKSFARVVRATPKGYTGLTRQEWNLTKVQDGEWLVHNDSKVMRFLEFGTKAHGPMTARALYIPLNRKAALQGWRPGLVFGQDYVLAKKVKGIQPLGVVARERERAEAELSRSMGLFLRRLANESVTSSDG